MDAVLRTLERALRIMGTKERLAGALSVTRADLDAYLSSTRQVPHEVFIAALDIVATRDPGKGPLEL